MDNSQQTVGAPPAPPVTVAPPKNGKNGLATASLVIGIIALIGAVIPFVNYMSGLVATVGAVLGLVAVIQKHRRNGTAIAGLIISVAAIILSIALAAAYTAGFAASVADATSTKTLAKPAAGAPAAEPAAKPAAPAAKAVGTRDNPAPIGTTVVVQDAGSPAWEVTPGKPTLDANALVAKENQFNDKPDAGMVYAMLPVTVKYVGADKATPYTGISIKFVSADGKTHESFDKSVVGPNDLSDVNDMYTGAKATGNVVIMVPTADIAKGTWVVGSMFGDADYFYAAQ
jgi:hypothetical protein